MQKLKKFTNVFAAGWIIKCWAIRTVLNNGVFSRRIVWPIKSYPNSGTFNFRKIEKCLWGRLRCSCADAGPFHDRELAGRPPVIRHENIHAVSLLSVPVRIPCWVYNEKDACAGVDRKISAKVVKFASTSARWSDYCRTGTRF